MESILLRADIHAAVAVKLLQLVAYEVDSSATGFIEGVDKRNAIRAHVQRLRDWPNAGNLPPYLRRLTEMRFDDSDFLDDVGFLLEASLGRLADWQKTAVVLDVILSTDWTKHTRWAIPKAEAIAFAVQKVDSSITTDDVESVLRAQRRAVRRLSKDAIAPEWQFVFALFTLSVVLLSGPVGEAIGTAVGTTLGYSGAAATSAGLALIGGGSLEAGGFGMAGGLLLTVIAIRSTGSASRQFVGNIVARTSPKAFIVELAKLDVRCRFDPKWASAVVRLLTELHDSLQIELDSTRAVNGSHRNLLTALRAVEAEIRYLESPDWKRWAAAVPRAFGIPAVARYLDRF